MIRPHLVLCLLKVVALKRAVLQSSALKFRMPNAHQSMSNPGAGHETGFPPFLWSRIPGKRNGTILRSTCDECHGERWSCRPRLDSKSLAQRPCILGFLSKKTSEKNLLTSIITGCLIRILIHYTPSKLNIAPEK